MHSDIAVAASPRDYSRKWLILVTVGMGIFLSTIDGTVVSVARPVLVEQLNTDLPRAVWVTVGYLLTVTVLLLSMGRLGDMIGKKRPYLAGMALFGIASALCGLAPTAEWLIAFRVVQAIGAAALQALGTAIITEAFPPTERGRALGLGGVLVSAGILTGPVLGGLLIDNVGWRAIFYVNVPVTVVGVAMVTRFVPGGGRRSGQRFDIPGAILLGVSLGALMLALTFGQDWGWVSVQTLGLLAMFAVIFVLFIFVELRAEQPMVDLTLFFNPQFAISLIMAVIVFIALASREVFPFFLVDGQGLSATDMGVLFAVWPLAMAITAPGAGWLSDRIGSMRISAAGLAVSALGYLLMATQLSLNITPLGFALLLVPSGVGVGLFQSPNNSAVMGTVPPERLGLASGFLALTRNMGQLIGIAAVVALWANRTLANLPDELAGTITDAAHATPEAIAAGTQETFLTLAGIIGLTVVLGLVAVWIERGRSRIDPRFK